MNVPSPLAATRRALSRPWILRIRLACGGAVAGLFAGSILGTLSAAFFDSSAFGIDAILIGPIAMALAGAAWGFLLGADASIPKEPLPEPCPPSATIRAID